MLLLLELRTADPCLNHQMYIINIEVQQKNKHGPSLTLLREARNIRLPTVSQSVSQSKHPSSPESSLWQWLVREAQAAGWVQMTLDALVQRTGSSHFPSIALQCIHAPCIDKQVSNPSAKPFPLKGTQLPSEYTVHWFDQG